VYVVVNDDAEVDDLGYLNKEYAEERAAHRRKADGVNAWVMRVTVYIPQPETKTEYVFPPHPVLPPSAVYTPETKEGPSWAYPAPRRVFQQPASLASAVSSAWTAWREAQIARGNLEAAAPEPPPIAQLFEESPSGQLELFPRALP
jgi:hypothetical protein